jgi:hypothetical protein
LGDFLNGNLGKFSRGVKISSSVFKSVIFFTNWFPNGVFWVSVSSESGVIIMLSIKGESKEKQWTRGFFTFKIAFDFVFKTGIDFFFFRVKKGQVGAVLGILETVIW